ncbi:Hpt domain-containing protein [Zunongwangia pacifica]|uniref:Hpt domain-containing protein n=1 Tax=Zunongwangia pacifica TaxID=2911062 RepID=A0A9X2CKE7_9FLAO|nr:Hpt domain-containing protein [Zunongwangia pacifica]MCL6218851.1 Hpt domain-containing protein [Zunongwangia pacifica]
MEKKSKELASRHAILIVHKDYDKIANLSLLFKEQGFYCLHVKSGLEAIKKFEAAEDVIKTLLIQEDSLPLNAYKTIDYIKTELDKSPYCVVLQESGGTEISGSHKIILIDRFFSLGEDMDSLFHDICEQVKNTFAEKPTNCSYSLGYLKEISDNSAEFIAESLQLFSTSVAKEIGDLYLKIKTGSYEDIRKIAHKIKPSFAMLENHKGVEICDQITYQAKDRELKNSIDDLYAEFNRIQHALKTDYPNLNL